MWWRIRICARMAMALAAGKECGHEGWEDVRGGCHEQCRPKAKETTTTGALLAAAPAGRRRPCLGLGFSSAVANDRVGRRVPEPARRALAPARRVPGPRFGFHDAHIVVVLVVCKTHSVLVRVR